MPAYEDRELSRIIILQVLYLFSERYMKATLREAFLCKAVLATVSPSESFLLKER